MIKPTHLLILTPFYKHNMIQHFPAQKTNIKARYSVFLPTWNNLDFLKACIKSIEKNSSVEHEILIHVNDGSDGTLEWVKSRGFAHTHSKENVGICFALNALRHLVNTEYILYLNDDMWVLPNWDTILFKAIEKRKDDMFFYSSTMIEPKDTGNVCAIAPLDFETTLEGFSEEKLIEASRKTLKENWSGSTWPPNIVSTRLWDLVGGYSVEFSPGLYSDPDFSKKLWEAGVRDFMGFGESRVYHFMSKSLNRVKKNDGRTQFLRKWGMSSSTFIKGFLKSGKTDVVISDEPDQSTQRRLLKDKLKRIYKR